MEEHSWTRWRRGEWSQRWCRICLGCGELEVGNHWWGTLLTASGWRRWEDVVHEL